MTKEQAREYATRIRLGEPLYWVGIVETHYPNAWAPHCWAVLGEPLASGCVVARGLLTRWGYAGQTWAWTAPGPGDGLPPGQREIQNADPEVTTGPVLAMLGQIANAP
jgi:hypothetical protein